MIFCSCTYSEPFPLKNISHSNNLSQMADHNFTHKSVLEGLKNPKTLGFENAKLPKIIKIFTPIRNSFVFENDLK